MIRYFTIRGLIERPSKNEIYNMVKEIRLLSYKELKLLFPDCQIYKERFFGFTKSFIVIRKPDY